MTFATFRKAFIQHTLHHLEYKLTWDCLCVNIVADPTWGPPTWLASDLSWAILTSSQSIPTCVLSLKLEIVSRLIFEDYQPDPLYAKHLKTTVNQMRVRVNGHTCDKSIKSDMLINPTIANPR